MKKKSLVIFTLVATITFGVLAQENKDTTIEKWRCFARMDFTKKDVLVELSRVTNYNEKFGYGEVSVAGITYRAEFYIAGFDRRWDFGDAGSTWNYSFVINPNGDGAYYDFSNVEDGQSTSPNQMFSCKSS